MKHSSLSPEHLALVNALMYEGYALYPYRRSLKNLRRWTIGCLYPKAYCTQTRNGSDWMLRTECLLESPGDVTLAVTVRFLHPLARKVGVFDSPVVVRQECPPRWPKGQAPPFQYVDSLQVDGVAHTSWQEAVEREVDLPGLRLDDLTHRPETRPFAFSGIMEIDPLPSTKGDCLGVTVYEQSPLSGFVEIQAKRLAGERYKLSVGISNLSTPSSDEVELAAMVGVQTVLLAQGGRFISLLDPPVEWKDCPAECHNLGTWPVLIRDPQNRSAMLSSPIILYDFPRIDPLSAGNLFDATEIDELLTLRIETLSEGEKAAMADLDERTRAVLNRVTALTLKERLGLHGRSILVPSRSQDTVLKPGDRVRLEPKAGGDILDLALAGKTARVVAVERDFEDRVHVAVTVDDDPGSDFGAQGQPGHRFFFSPDEVRLLEDPIEPHP